ncbi:hypothetical protein ANTPLA_LOCUS9832 [Anthophora plagiata]
MFRRYLKLFKQKRSRYISWDILLFWGIVLWIALCASNMYHTNVLKHEATLSYLQNSNIGIPSNISTKPEMEEMLHIKTTNYSICNMILMSVFQYVHVLMSMFLVIIFICSQEYVKKVIKIWNAIFELYRYFSNQQLKHNLIYNYLPDQSSAYIKNHLVPTTNNCKRSDDCSSKKYMQKGIVSSSPEFQQFLANLRRPQFLYPYTLEVSASCIIRIKSTYK